MSTYDNKKIWHIILGGSIGNLNEWYNFLLYGYLASTISQLFFPLQDQLLSLTLTFTVFALSFLARPFGGILFGWIGDTYGRKRALLLSLLLMGVPSLMIGLLPTYDSIGVASPVLLCLLRTCQGLSAGGEHTGSAIYIAEYAPASRRSLWVSSVPTSAALGILISSGVALLIINSFSEAQLLHWGWRVGYWIGAGLSLVSILLRLTLPDSPQFIARQNQKTQNERLPLSTLLKEAAIFKNLLVVFSLAGCWGVFYQILFIWMPTYLTTILKYRHEFALQVNSFYILCLACLIVVFGYLSDHISRKKILMSACLAMGILAYPLFIQLSSGSVPQVITAMGIFTLIFSLFLPSAFVSMVESFDTLYRYTGLSFGFNVGLALFGGTCPLIVTWLIEITGNSASPALYMILAAVVALWTTKHIQDKRGLPI